MYNRGKYKASPGKQTVAGTTRGGPSGAALTNYTGGNAMKELRPIIALALRLVAVAMATASILLIALNVATIQVHVVLLAVGLFALCIASIVWESRP